MRIANTSVLAAALALGLATQSAPASAWYQWYQQDAPLAPLHSFWLYQSIPYGAPGAVPAFGQTSPWFSSYQPGLHYWWTMPVVPNAIQVQQSQSALGYHVRVNAPSPRLGNLKIGVEAGGIVIRSGDQQAAGQPYGMQQMGWSTQWVALPADANLAAMRMSRSETGIEVFVPRFP